MNDRIKELAEQSGIPISLYPDIKLYEPIFNLIIKECCDIAVHSGKPIIAKRIRERLIVEE